MKLLKLSPPDQDIQYSLVYPDNEEDIRQLQEMLYMKDRNKINMISTVFEYPGPLAGYVKAIQFKYKNGLKKIIGSFEEWQGWA